MNCCSSVTQNPAWTCHLCTKGEAMDGKRREIVLGVGCREAWTWKRLGEIGSDAFVMTGRRYKRSPMTSMSANGSNPVNLNMTRSRLIRVPCYSGEMTVADHCFGVAVKTRRFQSAFPVLRLSRSNETILTSDVSPREALQEALCLFQFAA